MTKDLGPKRTRFTVELPCGLDRRLETLSAQTGLSKSEVIREAVKLLAEMSALKAEGYAVGGTRTNEDGSRETVRILVEA